MKLLKAYFLVLFVLVSVIAQAQVTGDTLIYQGFNYNSTTRDTVMNFPNNPNLSFEKIIMLYSMRCKDGLVSTGSQRNKGCGEWDYSCNTYITDSAHVDSNTATQAKYVISGWSGTSYPYVTTPTYKRYQSVQPKANITSIISEDTATLGAGNSNLQLPINTSQPAGKTQMLITAAELSAGGLTSGSINGIALFVNNTPGQAKLLRIRLKGTSATALDPATPNLSGFTEVYYHNTTFGVGANRLQFYTPFAWNGTSNIIVDISFTNKTTSTAVAFAGDSIASGASIVSTGSAQFDFNGSNYILANNYKGVTGTTNRTIEAWIKTTGTAQDIVYYGSDVSGQKYRFWVEGAGKLRTEVNGGYAVGTTTVNDGQWHHVAMVQSGPNTNQIQFYVDGAQETISLLGPLAINTAVGSNVNITKGVHNKYWVGQIAEVRMWSTALSATNIQNWMSRAVDSQHPNYSALEMYYQLNENTGNNIDDASPNNRDGSVFNGAQWSLVYGIDYFKNWTVSPNRPKTSFFQGTYNQTIVQDTVVDTLYYASNLVTEFQIFPKPGTMFTDSIGVVMQSNFWQAGLDSLFAPDSTLISALPVTPQGTFTQASLPYWRRFAAKFEMTSFVTPYGINLNLGLEGKTWAIDVTDFAPILKNNRRINMEWGGQWQEDIDIKFMFIVGTPPADVVDIQNLWKVSKESYTRIMSDAVFEPRTLKLNPAATSYKIRTAITGHGQQGEFIPRTHWLKMGGSTINSWQVWKACGLNPVYPQGGTWIYDRAGWCPGMATDIQETELVNVTPGQSVQLDYGIATATGASDYIVSNQLVSYGEPNFTLDAAVVEILNPTNRIEYSRTGTICTGPVVRIRNTGSTVLTSLLIKYWVNNTSSPEVYNWTGALGFGEIDEINLPVVGLWHNLNGTPENTFHVEVSLPNGGADSYSNNNHMYSTFEIPMVIPNKFFFGYKSNLAPQETSYKVIDDQGTVVFTRSGGMASTVYVDTLTLPDGCYTLQIDDTGNDGISFWANNDGSGYFRIFNGYTNALIQTLQGDFGKAITLPFTVNSPLSFEEFQQKIDCRVYPNPNNGHFTIEAHGKKAQDWQLTLLDVQGKVLWKQEVKGQQELLLTPDFNHLPTGIYLLQMQAEGASTVHKVIVE